MEFFVWYNEKSYFIVKIENKKFFNQILSFKKIKYVSSVLRNLDTAFSTSLWSYYVPQINLTEESPYPHLFITFYDASMISLLLDKPK